MKVKLPFSILCIIFAFQTTEQLWAASRITKIDFNGKVDPNLLMIKSDGPVTFRQDSGEENQVVIEITDAVLPKSLGRKIDTSSFQGALTLISPYQVPNQENTVRVVLQFNSPPPNVEISQSDLVLTARVSGGPSSGSTNDNEKNKEKKKESIDQAQTSENESTNQGATDSSIPLKTKLEQFLENRATQRFIGKPITLQVRDMDVGDVFRLIGDASGFNIILGDDVKGKITLSLTDVPWDQVLDVILHTLGLGADRTNNILRIMTLQALTVEKESELRAQRASEANAPRVTRIFPISYASLTDLEKLVATFGGFGSTSAGQDRSLVSDNRTNSLIIRDLPNNIERIKKLIDYLDTQTPQVLIEGKVVEAGEDFTSRIVGRLGLGKNGGIDATSYFGAFNTGTPLDSLFGSPGVQSINGPVGDSGNGGAFGFSPSVNFIPGFDRLNALLALTEVENQAKIVAAPKAVVLNKEKATIVQGTPVGILTETTSGGITTRTTSVQIANLRLEAKPTVTNDGSVLLELTLTRDTPRRLTDAAVAVANRSITTIVLVESGTTLVLGGFYTITEQKGSSGMPWLRKIPIIGTLFGNESSNVERAELFFFITPQILNPKKAGLNS